MLAEGSQVPRIKLPSNMMEEATVKSSEVVESRGEVRMKDPALQCHS